MQSNGKNTKVLKTAAGAELFAAFLAVWLYGAVKDRRSFDHAEWKPLKAEEKNEILYKRRLRGF